MHSHSLYAGGDAAQSAFTAMSCFKLAVKVCDEIPLFERKVAFSCLLFLCLFPLLCPDRSLGFRETGFHECPWSLRKSAA